MGAVLGLMVAWLAACLSTPSAVAADRVALVIGNGAYRHADALPNPTNDAQAIAAALQAIGFEVVAGYDLDATRMQATIERFERAQEAAAVALVYYSGHGVGVDGVNYLLPVDAKLDSRSDLKREAYSADWLLNDVMQGGDRVSIIMLDACRNNPLARSFAGRTRSTVSAGLAEVRAQTGSYVAFATAPGEVAYDGGGEKSPFTTAVLRHLTTPGLEIDRMMKLVRREVYTETDELQLPWTNSALLGEFYFVPPADEGSEPVATVAALSPPGRTELRMTALTPPQQPSEEELRVAALQRVETVLLPTATARRKVQEELTALGFAPGRPDGRFGRGTRTAIRSFQAASSLEATGYVDKPTLAGLDRQVARLEPPAEPPAPTAKEPAERRPAPDAVTQAGTVAAPTGGGLPGWTMGICATTGGVGWASERHLTLKQCRAIGGSFTPF